MKDTRRSDRFREVRVAAASGPYPVIIGAGALSRLPEIVSSVAGAGRVALVSDSNVLPLHGEGTAQALRSHGVDVTVLTFPAGEAAKTRTSWARLTDEMLAAGLGRDCCVVAVGGGVTTDLAGFVAATYLRGVPVVQVPTSYLAMIDASVGGKTGVDVRAGKNLVGSFHPPVAVVADTEVASTLPKTERARGLVEGVKHGAILDEGHFDALYTLTDALLDAAPEALAVCVEASVGLKGGVVTKDEREGGYRQILNFGHTIGHAVEAASEYALSHGAAVALGMLAEADLGERMGITEPGTRARLASVLQPLMEASGDSLSAVGASDLTPFLGMDKKARKGQARFVLLEGIGRVAPGDGWSHEAPDHLVGEVVERMIASAS